MLHNYLKTAWRNLARNKSYTIINIVGLAVGIACCILIFLYAQNEFSYDDFNVHSDRIYRLLRGFDLPNLKTTIARIPSAVGPMVEKAAPAVKKVVRIRAVAPTVQHNTREFVESSFAWVDDGFFDVFTFPILRGEAALNRPGTAVITKNIAHKYFGNANPIGQTLIVNGYSIEVTGIMRKIPDNSSLQFNIIASLKTLSPKPVWHSNNYVTFIMLKKGVSKSSALQQIDQIISSNPNTQYKGGDGFIPYLQPLSGIHFGTGVSVDTGARGILYIYLFSVLAFFILLLACINFANMATARSTERAREVGMRKSLGARRSQLVSQFFGEAILLSIAATILAVGFAYFTLPLLNEISGKSLSLDSLFSSLYVVGLLVLPFIVGLIAGSYPAIALSKFKPVEVLRGSFSTGKRGRRFRRILVIFQFAVTIAILVGTLVVYRQLHFMLNANLGFNRKNVVVIGNADRLGGQRNTFIQELKQISGVEQATSAFSAPGGFLLNSMWLSAEPNAKPQNLNYSFVGKDYVDLLGIQIIVGQDFGPATLDTSAVMLNEAAAATFGWTPQEAIGKTILRGDQRYEVVGVMRNFHYKSLQRKIYPLLLFPPIKRQRQIIARINPKNIPATLDQIRSTWEQFSNLPLGYSFLADDLAAQYREQAHLATVFITFTVLGIIVACLGLFSLAAYTAERRTKEIGIRKVLGASVMSIVGLLSKDFLKLVVIGFLIAIPVAWYFMHRWLQNFAYKINLNPWIFILAGVIAMIIALATVSWQSIRAALANPVDSLRLE